jgi:host factor-I protein
VIETQCLQEYFLQALKDQQVSVAIFLKNGIKLEGHILNFDEDILVLKSTFSQMVFKHAIATIVPARSFSLSTKADN